MGSDEYEVTFTVVSGTTLFNVNWRDGFLRPYVRARVAPSVNFTTSTMDNVNNDNYAEWNETFVDRLRSFSRDEGVLHFEVIHAKNDDEVGDDLVGYAEVNLWDIRDEGMVVRTLQLKHHSGRLCGSLKIQVCVRRVGEPSSSRDRPSRSDRIFVEKIFVQVGRKLGMEELFRLVQRGMEVLFRLVGKQLGCPGIEDLFELVRKQMGIEDLLQLVRGQDQEKLRKTLVEEPGIVELVIRLVVIFIYVLVKLIRG